MKHCTECQTVEGKSHETEDEIEVCDECGAEDSIEHYDEDYGKDR